MLAVLANVALKNSCAVNFTLTAAKLKWYKYSLLKSQLELLMDYAGCLRCCFC